VIPLHDDNPTRRLPLVTMALIGLNVAVFVFTLLLPRYGLTESSFYARAGVTPYELTHGVDVAPPGLVPWWATIFSSMFIHGGWLHILFNMLFLWVFGNNVEDAMTRPRFLAFYLICGMVATAAQVMTAPDSTAPLIGASGAIAGVLGAYLVLYPRARVLTVLPLFIVFPVVYVPAWMLLLIWFAVQAVQGVTMLDSPDAGVAFFAHVGGFVAGLTLVLLFVDRRRRRPSRVRLG
jgi:membrane associated rhomboid family serine protease